MDGLEQTTFAQQPPSVHGDTSESAAEAIKPHRASQWRRIHERLILAGWEGMTDQEIQRATGLDPSTERPRRGELVDAGLVYDSGRKRRTVSGRRAIVWRAS